MGGQGGWAGPPSPGPIWQSSFALQQKSDSPHSVCPGKHVYRLSPTVMLILLQDTLLPVAARKPCALSLGAGFVSSPGRVLCPQHPSDQAPQGEDCVHSTPVTQLPRESAVSTAPQ